MKRILQIGVMFLALVFISGCGSKTIMDNYSFGHQLCQNGKSYIDVFVPFGLRDLTASTATKQGLALKQLEDSTVQKDVSYQGASDNMVITVVGDVQKGGDKGFESLPQIGKSRVDDLANNPQITDLKIIHKEVKVENLSAIRIDATYQINGLDMGLVEYVFIDRGVLWSVFYRYNPKSVESVDLMKYVSGKIKVL